MSSIGEKDPEKQPHYPESQQRGDQKRFRCTYNNCGCTFDSFFRFKQHLYLHKQKETYNCTYTGCSYMTLSYSLFQKHLECHRNLYPSLCEPEGEDDQGQGKKKQGSLIEGENAYSSESKEEKKERAKSPKEPYEFRSNEQNHNDGQQEKGGKEDQSGTDFNSPNDAFLPKKTEESHKRKRQRIFIKQYSDKLYKCTYPNCYYTFTKESEYERHLVSHSSMKEYACHMPNCHETAKGFDALLRHLLYYHRNSTYPCLLKRCSKTFRSVDEFQKHVKEHYRL